MSQLRILTVKFDPEKGAMDSAALDEFLRDKVLLSAREHFFTHKECPYLIFVVEYAERSLPGAGREQAATAAPYPAAGSPSPRRRGAYPKTDELRATLGAEKQRLFDELRRWRRSTAEDEAVPPYVILTNQQLMDVTNRAPQTRAEMMSIVVHHD